MNENWAREIARKFDRAILRQRFPEASIEQIDAIIDEARKEKENRENDDIRNKA